MIKALKTLFAATLVFAASLVSVQAVAQPAYAQNNSTEQQNKLCGAAADLSLNSTKTCSDDTITGSSASLDKLIKNIVNIFSIVVGIVAVIMIIVGGFRYITSGGDSGNVTGAKNTILYAIVGLIIVALAQFIVRFVLNQSTDLTT